VSEIGSVARTSESEERLVFRHNYPSRVNRRISGVNTAISCFVDLQNALWERFKIKWHFNNYPGSVDDYLMVFADLLRFRRKDHPSAIAI
jgi:hypothetical protein